MNIVLTGSLGRISKPLAEILLRDGHAVTVVSSTPDRKAAIEALGATAAIGSVDDPAFLAQAFRGADAVYCMVPPHFGAPDQLAYYKRIGDAYAAAIRDSGVRRVVELSSYGAHLERGTGFIVGSHVNEKTFDALPGVAVTHLRPGSFYYNLLAFIPIIKAAGFIASNYGGDDRVAMVAPKDIAAVAAEELVQPTGDAVRYIVSDDRTCTDVARVLGAAIGKPELEWKVFSDDQVLQGLRGAGVPESAAAMLVELGAATHSGALREDYERNKTALGPTKLETFAPDFVAAYNGGAPSGH